jgi:hypothetical protein
MGNFWNKPVADLAYFPRGMEVKPHISLPDILAYYAPLVEPPKKKMAVFWVVAQCNLVEVYRRFRGPCCRFKFEGLATELRHDIRYHRCGLNSVIQVSVLHLVSA